MPTWPTFSGSDHDVGQDCHHIRCRSCTDIQVCFACASCLCMNVFSVSVCILFTKDCSSMLLHEFQTPFRQDILGLISRSFCSWVPAQMDLCMCVCVRLYICIIYFYILYMFIYHIFIFDFSLLLFVVVVVLTLLELGFYLFICLHIITLFFWLPWIIWKYHKKLKIMFSPSKLEKEGNVWLRQY